MAKARKTETKCATVDSSSTFESFTSAHQETAGVSRVFRQPAEQELAKYASTLFINKYADMAMDSRKISNPPSVCTVKTGVTQSTQVYKDVTGFVNVDFGGQFANGIFQAVELDEVFRISIGTDSKESASIIEAAFNDILEHHNFYQGQTLRYSGEGVDFMRTPSTNIADAILPPETHSEYQLNVVEFLTNPKMYEITKMRGIILHGPPGTGKTTSVKGLFNKLKQLGITCVHISDASFMRFSVEDVFDFIHRYLAPCLIVFEDIDLIAADRKISNSRIIGPLLTAMNGIEEAKKPIVILATTNRPEVLDAAVTRPCRFDRKIKVDYPTNAELNMIFKNISGFAAPKDLLVQPSDESKKMTGAHVEEIYKTAAMMAELNGKNVKDCIVEAVETIQKHFFIVQPKMVEGFGEYIQSETEEPTYNSHPVGPRDAFE